MASVSTPDFMAEGGAVQVDLVYDSVSLLLTGVRVVNNGTRGGLFCQVTDGVRTVSHTFPQGTDTTFDVSSLALHGTANPDQSFNLPAPIAISERYPA